MHGGGHVGWQAMYALHERQRIQSREAANSILSADATYALKLAATERKRSKNVDLELGAIYDYPNITEEARFSDVSLVVGNESIQGQGRLICARYCHEAQGQIEVCEYAVDIHEEQEYL